MERRKDGGMDVATIDALGSLDLELHVILTRCLPVLSLLPTVAVTSIPHFLSTVQHHGTALRSEPQSHVSRETEETAGGVTARQKALELMSVKSISHLTCRRRQIKKMN